MKSYFIANAHDKSDGKYANRVRQLVTPHEINCDRCKPEVV